MNKHYLGIDPGKTGGVSLLSNKGKIEIFKMPQTERDMFELFEYLKVFENIKAVIEKVSCMPGQGVKSVWTFSGNYHGLRMCLIGNSIPFDSVRPQEWQKHLGCMTKGDKNVSKRKAQELFPDVKVTHAIADSMLIAEYLRRISR